MALPTRLTSQARSSTSLIRSGVFRRGLSTANGSAKGRAYYGNAVPFLLGAASAATTLVAAAKYNYDNKHKFDFIQTVHAGARFVVCLFRLFFQLQSFFLGWPVTCSNINHVLKLCKFFNTASYFPSFFLFSFFLFFTFWRIREKEHLLW